jgi:hypothetical protein
MFNATEVQLCKWCYHIKLLLYEANTRVALPNAPSVITTIMDHKLQRRQLQSPNAMSMVPVCERGWGGQAADSDWSVRPPPFGMSFGRLKLLQLMKPLNKGELNAT